MARQRVIIWFPNGDAEFYAGFDVPSVGDRITRNNSDWIVARVESHIDKSVRVTVMPSEVGTRRLLACAVRVPFALSLSNMTGVWVSSVVLIGAVLLILVLAMRG